MRDLIYDYIESNLTTGFTLSSELPWDKGNTPLYMKNMKSIYVDQAQTVQEPLFDTLDGTGFVNELTTVSVYVATDAKKLPSSYDAMVTTIRAAKLDTTISGYTQKVVLVDTEYDGDNVVTQFDFNFTKIMQ